MTELLGKSVGEWSANESVNFSGNPLGNNTRNCDALILANWRQCGISFTEWSRRASANSTLKKQGLSSVQIAKYWKKFQNEVQSKFDRGLFVSYALDENKKEYDASQTSAGSDRSGRGRDNTDVSATTDKGTARGEVPAPNSGSLANSSLANSTTPSTEKSNKSLYIYGGIGLAVIVGAFLIFKKK